MIIQVVPANNKNSCTVLTNNGQCSIVLTGDDQTGNGPTDIVPTSVHLGSIPTGHHHTTVELLTMHNFVVHDSPYASDLGSARVGQQGTMHTT